MTGSKWPGDVRAIVPSQDVDDFLVVLDHRGCDKLVDLLLLLAWCERGPVCVSLQGVLGHMTEWPVADIVEKSGVADQLDGVTIQIKAFGHLTGDMCDTQRVVEACMNRARIDKGGQSELPDTTGAL